MLERIGRSPWVPMMIGLLGLSAPANSAAEVVAEGWKGSFIFAVLRYISWGGAVFIFCLGMFGLMLGVYHHRRISGRAVPLFGIILGGLNLLTSVACVLAGVTGPPGAIIAW